MSHETLGSQGGQCVYGVALAELYRTSQFMTHGSQYSNGSRAETFLSTLRSNLARKHIQMAPALLEPAAGANASTASSSSALTAELSMETEVWVLIYSMNKWKHC